MEEVKKQHYVPRTYLKHFSSMEDEFVQFVAVPFATIDAIKQINVKNICFEKHIYTLPGATPEERMLLEKVYSDFYEKDYDKVYSMLIDPKKLKITNKEREFVISTVIMLYYRTTSWNHFAYNMMDDIID